MRPIPEELRAGPFTHRRAGELGVTPSMLTGRRFVRIFPRVHRAAAYEMTDADWRAAGAMALPTDARLTGISRIQAAGLDFGPRRPLRFVVARDHHLDLDGIFVHRTKRMPPCDDVGVTVASAFVAYCGLARTLDAIKVGDWLLHHGAMSEETVRELALRDLWRAGADEALWVLPHFVTGSRSLKESELRAFLVFAGLPPPQVNQPLALAPGEIVMGDLWWQEWQTMVEYEGTHHQADRATYHRDIDRYALMRDHDLRYVQITKERSSSPQGVVRLVHRQLARAGYVGPPPDFTGLWPLLFGSLTVAVGERTHWRAS